MQSVFKKSAVMQGSLSDVCPMVYKMLVAQSKTDCGMGCDVLLLVKGLKYFINAYF